ncbi:MAG: formylglycine-generating enzyme family protein [Bacteroides sp.]|nr:formylglycine-generating enzyme family protein [Bacteroides sp.]
MKKKIWFSVSLALLLFLPACRQKKAAVEPDPVMVAETARLEEIEKNIPAPEDYTDTLFGVPMEMVYVAGGLFTMGGIPGRDGEKIYGDEKPAHVVEMHSFYISRYPVTQELWEAVMGDNPSVFPDPKGPVSNVLWNEAIDFCVKIELATGQPYMLPSEAQWEYAARGGVKTRNTTYSGSDFLDLVACHSQTEPCPVGQYKPNELGIYDMCGGVWELCSDWYGEFLSDTVFSPRGPDMGFHKVLKGGSWGSAAKDCRIAQRSGVLLDQKGENFGFRVVMNRSDKIKPKN